MPRLTKSVPSYREHSTGRAVVTINGKDIYLVAVAPRRAEEPRGINRRTARPSGRGSPRTGVGSEQMMQTVRLASGIQMEDRVAPPGMAIWTSD